MKLIFYEIIIIILLVIFQGGKMNSIRAGKYIEVNKGIASYKAYKPNPLPPYPELEVDEEMVSLLSLAHNQIGKLDTMSSLIPDVDLFISSYVRKEALLSSQIEGTQATLEDIFNHDIGASVNLDVNDVVNYAEALTYAIDRLNHLPICNRLLCETHKVLLNNCRGNEKNPGEFRNSQNWIGAANSNIKNARYIPPTVDDMKDALSDLEKFINNYEMNILLKTALVHYQFETIHPFLDGNGRIGRMLIILMLISNGILKKPILYLSLFLKTNQIEYYDRLSEVRKSGNYEQWIKFFLQGINETCIDSINMIENMDILIKKDNEKVKNKNEAINRVFNYLKKHPIINIVVTSNELGLSYNTTSNAVKDLIELNILKETSTKSRNRIFEYVEYVDILKAGI